MPLFSCPVTIPRWLLGLLHCAHPIPHPGFPLVPKRPVSLPPFPPSVGLLFAPSEVSFSPIVCLRPVDLRHESDGHAHAELLKSPSLDLG